MRWHHLNTSTRITMIGWREGIRIIKYDPCDDTMTPYEHYTDTSTRTPLTRYTKVWSNSLAPRTALCTRCRAEIIRSTRSYDVEHKLGWNVFNRTALLSGIIHSEGNLSSVELDDAFCFRRKGAVWWMFRYLYRCDDMYGCVYMCNMECVMCAVVQA